MPYRLTHNKIQSNGKSQIAMNLVANKAIKEI
jgi:hypothetical protein